MLKNDLVEKISEDLSGHLKKDLREAVDIILATVVDALKEGRRVEIRGFGSFSVRSRKARVTQNPKTGKTMNIPSRKTVHFTMSKSLKEPLAGKSRS